MRVRALVLISVVAAPCLTGQSQNNSTGLQRALPGDPAARVQMGNRYAFGQGLPRAPDKAMAWLRKAADKGYAEAQYRRGGI